MKRRPFSPVRLLSQTNGVGREKPRPEEGPDSDCCLVKSLDGRIVVGFVHVLVMLVVGGRVVEVARSQV